MVRDGALRLLTMRNGLERHELERIPFALDVAGIEMPADHQCRRVGKARKQLAAGFGRLPVIGIRGRRPVEMGHLAGVVGDVPREQAFLALGPDVDAHMAGAVAGRRNQGDFIRKAGIAGDEITLIPTPGHSPGHMSIHIQSDGEQALLTGDVAHHPCQMAHLDWSSTADSEPAQSAATRRELFGRFADTPTLVIGGHFDAGHIRRDGEAFRFVV